MKTILSLVSAAALLSQAAFAAPVDTGSQSTTAATPDAMSPAALAAYTPKCKTAAHYNLCVLPDNANAYCNDQGKFHNDFMASCKDVCWCV